MVKNYCRQYRGFNMNKIEVKDLKVHFPVRSGFWGKATSFVKAVDGVSFSVPKGSIYSLVGESGSGKSTIGNAILGLIPKTSGQIIWDGADVMASGYKIPLGQRRLFQMIYQDSHSSLNPRCTIFEILSRPMIFHNICTYKSAKDRVVELLEQVHLDPDMMKRFPHEFSGGQRQRINIARTLAVEPEFIVCDEIISALDVSIQAEILYLMQNIQKEKNLTLLFIGHDLAVVKNISDYIGVMYQGQMEEFGTPEEIFKNTKSDYTKKLISCVPSLDLENRKRKLKQ